MLPTQRQSQRGGTTTRGENEGRFVRFVINLLIAPCSFLLWILTHKRFHSNLAIAPTCDTASTYHITDNARDPQRGLSRATHLLKVSRRAAQPNEEES